MLPPGFIQDLLSRIDVVEVVGRHVELKRGGANLMGLCPFHGEKSPSFSVSPSKQFYYCFGCGASGDAIRFLTEHLGLTFIEAVRDLAQQAGLQVPEEQVSPEEQVQRGKLRERRLAMGDLLTQAADFYRAQLRASPQAIAYLKRRGLTGAVAKRFTLGYAPARWRALAGVFARYDDPLLEEGGLVRLRDADDAQADPAGAALPAADGEGAGATPPAHPERQRYDWFRDRIMFPIRAVSGEIIGFGGRVLDDSKPKYLNSPETPLFSKGRELYGLFEARNALRSKGYALVVEGYMDVVALAQWGYPNAVATLGTACTADHVTKLFRFTDAVVFSFDGDAAGRRAAGKALEATLALASDTRSVRFLFLPPEHDPDSYIRELGPAAFEQALAQAVPLSEQLVKHASADADLGSAEGRAKMLSQARPLIALLPDGLLREQLTASLARHGDVPIDTLRAHWLREPRSNATRTDALPGPDRPRQPTHRRHHPGRTTPGTATQLDRAAWLLTRHADLWLGLSHDTQVLLCEQPAPHGPYFCTLERHLHDHGPLAMSALLQDLQADAQADALRPVIDRVMRFHDVDGDPPPGMLEGALRSLELAVVNQTLRDLAAKGDLSAASTAQLRALYARQAELKRAAIPSA